MATVAMPVRPAPEGNLASLLNKKVRVYDGRTGKDREREGLVIRKYDEWGTSWISPKPPSEQSEFIQVGVLMYGSSDEIWWFPRSALRFWSGSEPYATIEDVVSEDRTPRQIDLVRKGDPISGILYEEFSRYLAHAGIQPPQ